MSVELFFCYGCDCQTYHERNEEGEYECLECGEIWDPPTRRFQGGTSRRSDGNGTTLQTMPAADSALRPGQAARLAELGAIRMRCLPGNL